MTAHARVELASAELGTGVKFDASAAADIVAKARRPAADNEAARRARSQAAGAAAAVAPAARRRTRARAIIRLDPSGRPHVYGVPLDFPQAALCGGTPGCPVGQHCGDRGDGVPLCFGPGAIHGFCGGGTDCASGVCARRPDGVGLCQ